MKKTEDRKDLRLELRVKNNILFDAIAKKYGSVAAFVRAQGLTASEKGAVFGLLCFRYSPWYKKSGEWKSIAIKCATTFDLTLEALFPRRLYERITQPKRVLEISSFTALPNAVRKEIALLPAPTTLPDFQIELTEEVDRELAFLNDRERKVIKMYFGLGNTPALTFDEIGKKLRISRSRAGQLLDRAIKKMQKRPRPKIAGPEWVACQLCNKQGGWTPGLPTDWEHTWLCQIDAAQPSLMGGIKVTDTLAAIRELMQRYRGSLLTSLNTASLGYINYRYGLGCGKNHTIGEIARHVGESPRIVRRSLMASLDQALWSLKGNLRPFENIPFGLQYRLSELLWQTLEALWPILIPKLTKMWAPRRVPVPDFIDSFHWWEDILPPTDQQRRVFIAHHIAPMLCGTFGEDCGCGRAELQQLSCDLKLSVPQTIRLCWRLAYTLGLKRQTVKQNRPPDS